MPASLAACLTDSVLAVLHSDSAPIWENPMVIFFSPPAAEPEPEDFSFPPPQPAATTIIMMAITSARIFFISSSPLGLPEPRLKLEPQISLSVFSYPSSKHPFRASLLEHKFNLLIRYTFIRQLSSSFLKFIYNNRFSCTLSSFAHKKAPPPQGDRASVCHFTVTA